MVLTTDTEAMQIASKPERVLEGLMQTGGGGGGL